MRGLGLQPMNSWEHNSDPRRTLAANKAKETHIWLSRLYRTVAGGGEG